MDAVILFWKLRQFKTIKIHQLFLRFNFYTGIDIVIVLLAPLFWRNVKKPKTVDIKTHYSKGSLHVGVM